VALVTGFFVPHAEPPAAETDGPPGTVLLAQALEGIGIETVVITDEFCRSAVVAAAAACGYAREQVISCPQGDTRTWMEHFYERGAGRELTHLVSIERVGPCHTPESLAAQRRDCDSPIEEFLAHVPVEARDRCHNMRGKIIDDCTANLHRLFELLPHYRPQAKTIGIGDGANEIGMGAIPWEELRRRLPGEFAARVPCRIATEWNIIAGTSNWGAYALAAATLVLRNNVEPLRGWNRERQLHVLERMVHDGPAVDGITGRPEATVDGLPFTTYLQPWEGIRRLLGFEEQSGEESTVTEKTNIEKTNTH
jgi:hypothetical protein